MAARYRQTDRRWILGACVAGAYLVAVAVLFALQVGEEIDVPIPFAVSAPPLVYAALSVVVLRRTALGRRLSWIGGACLTHVVLGVLAAMELAWAGGLPPVSAVAQVFALFAPAPALTLLATPLVLGLLGLTRPSSTPQPRAESAAPRPAATSPSPRPRSFARPTLVRKVEAGAPPPQAVAAPAPPSPAPAAVPPPAAPPPPPPSTSTVERSSARAAAPIPEPPVAAPPLPAAAAPAPRGKDRDDDVMVRVSFEGIASQLPAEAFVLPFDRLAESLKEPHALLVPRRVVLAQMREGGIAIDWQTVAAQFPDLALGVSEAEFRARYPDLKLSLPVDEVLAQLPADTRPLVTAVLNTERLELPPPLSPRGPNGRSSAAFSLAPPAAPLPAASPAPPPSGLPVPVAAETVASPPAPSNEMIDRETVARMVACFSGAGTFEAVAERVDGKTLVALVAPSIAREAVAACAARVLPLLAREAAEVVTVRTARAVVVLAAGSTPVLVATRRPGAPTALLELRAARAAAAGPGGVGPPARPPARSLEPLTVDARVAGAGHALASFGAVEPAAFADGRTRVYVFSASGRDAAPVGGLALSVSEALGETGELGRLVSVVFRRGGERTILRPLGRTAILAASGPVRFPGRAHRDADRAAAALETP
jgi:hypothetical protein